MYEKKLQEIMFQKSVCIFSVTNIYLKNKDCSLQELPGKLGQFKGFVLLNLHL